MAIDSQSEFEKTAHWFAKKQAYQKRRPVEKMDSIVTKIIKDVTPKHDKFSSIKAIWQEILPGQLVGHCRIAALDRNILRVKVESSSWIYQLQMLKGQLLKQLNAKRAGAKIRSIKFEL